MAKRRKPIIKLSEPAHDNPDIIRVLSDGAVIGDYWENLSAFEFKIAALTPEQREERHKRIPIIINKQKRPRKMSAIMETYGDIVIAKYRNGDSENSICRDLGLGRSTVDKILEEMMG